MKKITIQFPLASKIYPIYIGNGLLTQITSVIDFENYSKIFIITDEVVAPLFLEKLLTSLPQKTPSIVFPTGENEKNIENAQKIWTAMYNAKLDRKSLVINLGGGVIGDMGGFAAATYMRGTHFINIPTTLLSQIDESVGGKTMVNFSTIKNLIGVFYQPSAVIIDTDTLKTLPERQFLSGFAEILKHGLIADEKYFQKVTSKKPKEFSQEELIEIITRSCEIKQAIVEQDETEKGQRKLVNFGHTIGHALEALSLQTNKPLLHGEAVSIGMVAEAKLSQLQNMLSDQDLQKIEQGLQTAGLPLSISAFDINNVLEKMQSDKKNEGGKINFTLLKTIGNATINNYVPDNLIREALQYIFI